MTDNHPDLITEGFTQSGQRLLQIISLAAIVQRSSYLRRAGGNGGPDPEIEYVLV